MENDQKADKSEDHDSLEHYVGVVPKFNDNEHHVGCH